MWEREGRGATRLCSLRCITRRRGARLTWLLGVNTEAVREMLAPGSGRLPERRPLSIAPLSEARMTAPPLEERWLARRALRVATVAISFRWCATCAARCTIEKQSRTMVQRTDEPNAVDARRSLLLAPRCGANGGGGGCGGCGKGAGCCSTPASSASEAPPRGRA